MFLKFIKNRSAIEKVFGAACVIISCYFHLLQNVRKNASKVSGGIDTIEKDVFPVIKDLHLASDLGVFVKFSEAALVKWRMESHEEFANWFQTTYLTERWRNWFTGAAPVTGLGLTNDPLEAFNKKVKSVVKLIFHLIPRYLNPFNHYHYII